MASSTTLPEEHASSSSASFYGKYGTMFKSLTCWNGVTHQDDVPFPSTMEPYNLRDLGAHYDITFGFHDSRTSSDAACNEFFVQILPKCCHCEIAKKAIPLLEESSLTELVCSKCEVPDLLLNSSEDITAESLVEVHSSSFEDTCLKCLLCTTDLLRLRRMYDETVNELTSFVFPKLPSVGNETSNRECVKKLVVTWENFSFNFAWKHLAVCEVKQAVIDVVEKFRPLCSLRAECTLAVPMRLSQQELALFPPHTTQCPARKSLLCHSKDNFFKMPFRLEDCLRLESVCMLPHSNFVHMIALEKKVLQSCEFFTYTALPYSPLHRKEAKECVGCFFCSMCDVLERLHAEVKIVHLDVRLENICFNKAFQPMLIDLDRSLKTDQRTAAMVLKTPKSCMYPSHAQSGVEMDWIQLGWLIAWVLDEAEVNYHIRTDLPKGIPEGARELLHSIIFTHRKCPDMDDVPQYFPIQTTIAEVLQKRTVERQGFREEDSRT